MSERLASTLHLLILWLLVTLAAWPCFVAVASAIGWWSGEARQLDAWALEPKRVLATQFLQGWRDSLIVTVPLGAVAVIDYLLLSRLRITWWFGGILLLAATTAIALVVYVTPQNALPTLLGTGALLVVLYRLFEAFRHRQQSYR